MRLVVYAYCFTTQYNNVLQYQIDMLGDKACEMTKTLLDKDLTDIEDLKKFRFNRRSEAFKAIVDDLNQIESDFNIIISDDIWNTMAKNFEFAMDDQIGSITVIGNIQKYGPDTNAVRSFLLNFGYQELKSRPPVFYVLDELTFTQGLEKNVLN